MIDPELKTLLDTQFGKIDTQFDLVIRTTKEGFDGVDEQFKGVNRQLTDLRQYVDERFAHIESDLADLKHRMSRVEQELITLSATMATKQYIDAKIEALLSQPPISKFEAMRKAMLAMMLTLERAKLLPSEQRAMFEAMIN